MPRPPPAHTATASPARCQSHGDDIESSRFSLTSRLWVVVGAEADSDRHPGAVRRADPASSGFRAVRSSADPAISPIKNITIPTNRDPCACNAAIIVPRNNLFVL